MDSDDGHKIVQKTMSLLRDLASGGMSKNLNELSKSGLDRVYNMIDLNEDGTIDTAELLLVLKNFVNDDREFNDVEKAALLNHFDMSRTGKINRENFEDKILTFQPFDASTIDSIDLFKKLADEETADLDAKIMDWMPDPRTYLLGIRMPTQQPQGGMDDDNNYLRDKSGRAISSKAAILGDNEPNDGGATAKEIADISRLRKLFQRLDVEKRFSFAGYAKGLEVFLELFGRKQTASLLIHFKKLSSPMGLIALQTKKSDEKVSNVRATLESISITWEQLFGLQTVFDFTEKLRKQKEGGGKIQNSTCAAFCFEAKEWVTTL